MDKFEFKLRKTKENVIKQLYKYQKVNIHVYKAFFSLKDGFAVYIFFLNIPPMDEFKSKLRKTKEKNQKTKMHISKRKYTCH